MDKPTLAENLELKGTKETATEEVTNYQISEEGGETDCGGNASMEEVSWFTGPLKILKMVPLKSKREIRTYVVLSSSDSVVVGNLLNKESVMNLCDWSFKALKNIILDVPSRVISAETESLKRKEVQVVDMFLISAFHSLFSNDFRLERIVVLE